MAGEHFVGAPGEHRRGQPLEAPAVKLLAQEPREVAGEELIVAAGLEEAGYRLLLPPRPVVDLSRRVVDRRPEFRRPRVQLPLQKVAQQLVGIAVALVVVHQGASRQEALPCRRLLPQHRLERLAADEVEHRKAQEHLLLLPRELRPEEFPQQRVHVPGLGQRPAVFQEMIEIQRHRRRPALGVGIDGLLLLAGELQPQLAAVGRDVPPGEKKVPGGEGAHAAGVFKHRAELAEVLGNEDHMQPVPPPVGQRLEKRRRPVVADELEIVKDEIARLLHPEVHQDVRRGAHVAAVEKPQLPERRPRRRIQLANLPDQPVQPGVLEEAHRRKPVQRLHRRLLERPAHGGGLAIARRRLQHHQTALVHARQFARDFIRKIELFHGALLLPWFIPLL